MAMVFYHVMMWDLDNKEVSPSLLEKIIDMLHVFTKHDWCFLFFDTDRGKHIFAINKTQFRPKDLHMMDIMGKVCNDSNYTGFVYYRGWAVRLNAKAAALKTSQGYVGGKYQAFDFVARPHVSAETLTNPELIGFEEQSNSITAVQLVIPRPGVFVPTITHVLVVATTVEMLMIGVAASRGATGITTVSLYQTRMSLTIKGIDVRVIEGSAATGRIFFAGGGDNEVYELTYQQEERWFSSRCGKINHTNPGYNSLVPSVLWSKKSP